MVGRKIPSGRSVIPHHRLSDPDARARQSPTDRSRVCESVCVGTGLRASWELRSNDPAASTSETVDAAKFQKDTSRLECSLQLFNPSLQNASFQPVEQQILKQNAFIDDDVLTGTG
ncbi:hypothetical protein GE061_000413 [Apolygus lucorum]|uniref:Uncharacterized protein n=1 Tax=Apolygus lucorum TaxID=248454 RepID=A0A8S9Y8K4_APOLU|nr:hypothetical protein GE061_000413 [Apolygus lucorum]